MDPKTIDWEKQIRMYAYGIQHFVMKQEVVPPNGQKAPLIRKNSINYFEDLKWAFNSSKKILSQNVQQIRNNALNSPILQQQIQNELSKQNSNRRGLFSEIETYDSLMNQAEKYLHEIEANIRPAIARTAFWFFQKIWSRVYS